MSLSKEDIKEVVKEMIREGELVVEFDSFKNGKYLEVNNWLDIEDYMNSVNIRLGVSDD